MGLFTKVKSTTKKAAHSTVNVTKRTASAVWHSPSTVSETVSTKVAEHRAVEAYKEAFHQHQVEEGQKILGTRVEAQHRRTTKS